MTAPFYSNIVNQLQNQYSGGIIYGDIKFIAHAKNKIENQGFMGSSNVLFLSSNDTIIHEAPACIAAPIVTMVAKEAIRLGMEGQNSQPVPVRLYTPERFSLTTKQLSIGDLTLLVEPEYGFISCKKLVLSKSTEEEPSHFEIVKSWLMNDDTEIETIQR